MTGSKTGAYVLNAEQIIGTVERLQARIEARFPGSGLAGVCAGLAENGRTTRTQVRALGRPYYGLRTVVFLTIAAGIGAQVYLARLIDWGEIIRRADPVGITQGLDSAVNLLILAFAAIWFVVTLEVRIKRRRVLRQLYELRSLAHVIDMHQLTKDPSIELFNGPITSVSPERAMTDFQLSRYLDYCTEMLALIAKLAALYGGVTQDTEIISAVNELEDLTNNLGRKIWQKIMVISNLAERAQQAGQK